MSTYALLSDTCNKTDDPSAGGDWATFAPGVGTASSSFKVTATKAGTKSNPARCNAVIRDGNGQSVTVDIEVTTGKVGIGERRAVETP
jgi:hypothetical protein